MNIGKKIAHKAEAAKGSLKSSSTAPRATPNWPDTRSKTRSSTNPGVLCPEPTDTQTRQRPFRSSR